MQDIIKQVYNLAVKEIEQYNIPKMEHFVLANEKGQELAKILGADKDIVLLGTMLMDLKIGQCMKENRLAEHVTDSALESKKFLEQFSLDDNILKKIISCIEQHHGADNYYCLEAEICANADCYRFLSPEGFFHGLMIFGNRYKNLTEALINLEKKVEEKYRILSLDVCKIELEDNYHNFKKLINDSKRS
jgi:hypothetical protein